MRRPIDICNADLTKATFKNVMFFSLAEGGAMGEPGAVLFYVKSGELEDGEITIDGVDIAEYANDFLRRGISYVPQNIELFSKSIYDNIRVGKQTASLEEVKEAAKVADAHDFIR